MRQTTAVDVLNSTRVYDNLVGSEENVLYSVPELSRFVTKHKATSTVQRLARIPADGSRGSGCFQYKLVFGSAEDLAAEIRARLESSA
jgi:hypothetical protein